MAGLLSDLEVTIHECCKISTIEKSYLLPKLSSKPHIMCRSSEEEHWKVSEKKLTLIVQASVDADVVSQ